MRAIKRWYRRTFILPGLREAADRQRAELLPLLRVFREKLQDVERQISQGDSLGAIVRFFGIVSNIQDKDIVWDTYKAYIDAEESAPDKIVALLDTLVVHIHNAGREEYGMNRTMSGQMVTADDIWLGGVCGLSTKQISYWARQKDSPRGEWAGTHWETYCKDMNAYDVVSRQAREFMEGHIRPMRELIDELEKFSSTALQAA
ncbi:hypothetical protein KW785_02775 [Candidatus Parcubacteria bacterium]|nr:hypothetical protein [Candidatus Parcubacteria bacterium]